MNCKSCENCKLVSQECFCVSQPNPGLQLAAVPNLIALANAVLEGIIGDNCMICLCDEQEDNSEILESKKFKNFYSYLIYYLNYCHNGLSQSAPKGEVQFNGDDDFWRSQKAVELKIWKEKKCEIEKVYEMLKGQFIKYFNSLKLDCVECESNCPVCDCQCGGKCEVDNYLNDFCGV